MLQLVEDLPVPVIGVANGVAVAGGLELLLCCDMIIAAVGAKIGDGHARYGVVPAGGATVRLIERLPPSRAAQLLYTASLVEAETLTAWGLVNEVVPKERLMVRAMEIAREVCACSPEVLRHVSRLPAVRLMTSSEPAGCVPNSRGSKRTSGVLTWQRASQRFERNDNQDTGTVVVASSVDAQRHVSKT